MIDGKVYMADYVPNCRKESVLKDLLVENIEDEKFYLDEEKIERFKIQKKGFREIKKSPKGYEYKYGMGSMEFPDSIDRPARTIVTSESTVSRMSHVVRDPGNMRLRVLSPIETERINTLSLIHISEPTRREWLSRMPSSA